MAIQTKVQPMHWSKIHQSYEQSRQKLGTFLENKVLKKSKFSKHSIKISWYCPNQIFLKEKKWKDSTNFYHWKMTFEIFDKVAHNFGKSERWYDLVKIWFSENMIFSLDTYIPM